MAYNNNYDTVEESQTALREYVEYNNLDDKTRVPVRSIDDLRQGELVYMKRKVPRWNNKFDDFDKGYGIVGPFKEGRRFVLYFKYGGDTVNLQNDWSEYWRIEKVEGVPDDEIESIVSRYFYDGAIDLVRGPRLMW